MGISLLQAMPQPIPVSGALPVDVALFAAVGAANQAVKGDHVHELVDTGWLTPSLLNGWAVYSATYGHAAMYRKIGPIVFIRGLMKGGAAGTTVIFNLPPGYRPAIRMLFGVESDTGHGRLDVATNGDVIHNAGGTAYYQISCYFVADN